MKTFVQLNRLATGLLCLLVALNLLSGCVMQDLEECPPEPPIEKETGKVWFKLSFTLHNEAGEDGSYEDLLARYAQSVEIFIFDNGGRLVKKQTDTTGPFAKNYRMQVELAPGDYRAITWVNLRVNPDITLLPEPQEGVTTFDEMQVRLRQIELKSTQSAASEQLPLFHGDTQTFTVRPNEGYDQEIIIPSGLTRDTNRIRFTISWLDKETHQICPQWMHADSTRIYIDDNYGALGFDNLPDETDSLTYIPVYHSAKQSAKSTASASNTGAILEAEVSLLRLLTTSTHRLRICRLQPDGSEKTVYQATLMKDFISHLYKTQEALDREELFDIKLEFTCEHPSAPDNPDNPDNPDDPDDPDNPDNPDNPDTPDNPDDPDNPDTPDTPGKEYWIAVQISINDWILVSNGDIDL